MKAKRTAVVVLGGLVSLLVVVFLQARVVIVPPGFEVNEWLGVRHLPDGRVKRYTAGVYFLQPAEKQSITVYKVRGYGSGSSFSLETKDHCMYDIPFNMEGLLSESLQLDTASRDDKKISREHGIEGPASYRVAREVMSKYTDDQVQQQPTVIAREIEDAILRQVQEELDQAGFGDDVFLSRVKLKFPPVGGVTGNSTGSDEPDPKYEKWCEPITVEAVTRDRQTCTVRFQPLEYSFEVFEPPTIENQMRFEKQYAIEKAAFVTAAQWTISRYTANEVRNQTFDIEENLFSGDLYERDNRFTKAGLDWKSRNRIDIGGCTLSIQFPR